MGVTVELTVGKRLRVTTAMEVAGNSRLAGVIVHCNIIFPRNKPHYELILVWSVFTYLTF